MKQTVIARKNTKPLKIKNIYEGGGPTNILSKGAAYFDIAASLAKGEQPSILDITGLNTSGSGMYGMIGQGIQDTGNIISGISTLTKQKQPSLERVIGLNNPYACGGRVKKFQEGGLTMLDYDPNTLGSFISTPNLNINPNVDTSSSLSATSNGLGTDAIQNIAEGTLGIVGNALQQTNNIKNTDNIKDQLAIARNTKVNDSSLDAVQEAANNMTYYNKITKDNLKNTNVGQDIGNVFKSTGQGAKAGSVLGPWGAVGGAAVGLFSSIGGLFGKNRHLINETRKINKMIDATNARNSQSISNAAENAYQNNVFNTMANYAALGGPIYPYNTTNIMGLYNTGDALGWTYLQDRLSVAQQKEKDNKENILASGGGIHINPKNKGKLTATAKRTGKSFSELAHSKNPLTRKRAIFALNARHFNHKHKHALGGDLQSNGANWDLGFTTIGNGGTHEMNPNEGVQIGIDNQGIPNLVEQGEVVYNDYVFSNRLAPTKELLKQFNLSTSYANKTFAKIAEDLSKNIKERPNDPISKRGLDANMQKLMQTQELLKQQQQDMQIRAAIENMSPEELQGLITLANQGAQQQAQEQAIQEQAAQEQMMAQQGINPNALGAEALYGACGGRLGKKYPRGGYTNYNPNDYDLTTWLKNNQYNPFIQRASTLYNVPTTPETQEEETPEQPKGSKLANLRYFPVLGSAVGLGYNLLHKPNYSNADRIIEAANAAGQYIPIRYNPIGNYLQYTPIDRNYYTNRLSAQANAQRRALTGLGNGNRATIAANMLAANNNYINQLGQLAFDAENTNWQRRKEVGEFNRVTNQLNSQMALEAARTNQSARQAATNARLSGIEAGAKLRQDLADNREGSMMANLTNLFDNIGNIGWEAYNRNTLQGMKSTNGYWIDPQGNPVYLPSITAYGGKIKKNKRK